MLRHSANAVAGMIDRRNASDRPDEANRRPGATSAMGLGALVYIEAQRKGV